MKFIVGLGNPGEQYEKTRHNMGFMVVTQFVKDFESVQTDSWSESKKLKSLIAKLNWQKKNKKVEQVIVVKPLTYMNNSGMALSLLVNFYKIDPSDVWVVYDELDLPFGNIKIRFGGAAAGHKGVESIINDLGTDGFWRLRLGIGMSHQSHVNNPEQDTRTTLSKQRLGDTSEFVLSRFTGAEWGRARVLMKHAVSALETGLNIDIETAQNRFNSK